MSALNYSAGLLFVVPRGLVSGMPAAVAGASLVASQSASWLNQMGHTCQLLPVLLLAADVARALRGCSQIQSLGWQARASCWLLAMAGAMAQLYTAGCIGLVPDRWYSALARVDPMAQP